MSTHTHRASSQRSGSRVTPIEVALVAITIFIAVMLMAASTTPSTHSVTATRTVRVQPSQTLWDLARTNPVPGNSTAKTVEYIRTLNDMSTSSLQSGQLITVPDATESMAMASR